MTSRTFAIAALVAVAASSPLRAQVLSGQLYNADRNPISVVTVSLRGPTGTPVAQTLSDADGRFVVSAPAAGTYTVEANRIGFQVWSEKLDLKAGDTTRVEIRLLSKEVTRVAGMVIEAPIMSRGRQEWEARRQLGVGIFLTGDDIRAKKTVTVLEALRDVPGISVVDQPVPGLQTIPSLRSSMGDHCLYYFLNGMQLPVSPEVPYEYTLNQMIGPAQVSGVEVYREYKEVPKNFRLKIESRAMLDQTSPVARSLDVGIPSHTAVSMPRTCGAVVFWTSRAW